MLARLCLATSLLALACGGSDGPGDAQTPQPGGGTAGATAGAAPTIGGSAADGGHAGSTAAAGAELTGGGGAAAGSAGTSTSSGAGGTPTPQGGQVGSAGDATAGQSPGGTASGAGGQPTDPLEPKPAANCPGYVDVYVPEQTCIWIHGGKFKMQNEACNVVNPPDQTCATVTALTKDSQGHGPRTARLSSGAMLDRVDLAPNTASCPKTCN